jgi:putative PIN family toxin of toxin-antitoxin system
MRVVVDTNVLISGILWEGNESKILRLCKTNELTNVISPSMIKELERVMSSEKFILTEREVNDVLELVLSFSATVFPTIKIDVIKSDPSDNMILESAVEGKADYIVSGDKHLLNIKKYENIPILNAKDMLKILQSQ